jgi:SAM-dependent methyltransferase
MENSKMASTYDAIGVGYASRRRPDPRIARELNDALGDSGTVLNVGAGAGSYEPSDRTVVAVEPSTVMIEQRPPGTVPAVIAQAERLPFVDRAFDASMAVMTVHHWSDLDQGLAELRRVTRGPIVVLTSDLDAIRRWWLIDEYAPEIGDALGETLPRVERIVARLGEAEVRPIPVPADCSDAFMMAFWNRPELVLDPAARAATSAFAQLPSSVEERIVSELASDLADGTWDKRHARLRRLSAFDAGLRLIRA